MRSYKVLTLTDHLEHTDQNSVYTLVQAMSTHERVLYVDVASRGNSNNDTFFKEAKLDKIYVVSGSPGFDFQKDGQQFIKGAKAIDPREYDFIFLRLPPPMSDDFLTKMRQILSKQVVVNNPIGMITCSSKAYLLNFPELCPPMKFCNSIAEVLSFSEKFDIVLKPLKEYGGKGLLKISKEQLNDGMSDWNTEAYLKSIEKDLEANGYLAMKFLKNVSLGDKRLLVVGGEIMAASLRLPSEGSWLCNVSKGGTSVNAEATEREKDIVDKINPYLEKHGILIYGVDTLVDDDGNRILSEINAHSIGGFKQAEIQTGKPIINMTLNKLFEYADAKSKL